MLINYGHREIHVEPLTPTEAETSDGLFDDRKNRIGINTDLSPALQVETLLHELGHLILQTSGLAERFREKDIEAIVTAMGYGYAALLAGNPNLRDALFLAFADGEYIVGPPP